MTMLVVCLVALPIALFAGFVTGAAMGAKLAHRVLQREGRLLPVQPPVAVPFGQKEGRHWYKNPDQPPSES